MMSHVIFGLDESIEITGHLRAWNFATGIVHLNMKWLMTYNLVSLFVVLGIIMFLKEETFSSPFFYDFFFLWILLSNYFETKTWIDEFNTIY